MKTKECLLFVFLYAMINFPCLCSNIENSVVNNNMNDDRQVSKHVANLSNSANHNDVQKMVNTN